MTISSISFARQSYPPQGKVLNVQQAKARLHTLKPDTQEYRLIENILLRTVGIAEVCLPQVTYKINTSLREGALLGGFGSSEHVAIGKAVQLQSIGSDRVLINRGGTQITFEYIIALAGDFYAIPNEPISLLGGSLEEKKARFMKAFNSLFVGEPEQIKKIMSEIELEFEAVRRSATPRHCYSCEMMDKNNQIRKIKKDINELLVDNSDHFEKNAIEAYQIGHQIALDMAAEAGKTRDIGQLKKAYALDAFACHFLTDLFSSGHTRNQRGELELFLCNTLGFSTTNSKYLSGLLAAAQHEKDGKEGLAVQNNKKTHADSWRMYGDGYFFLPQNEENRRHVMIATQRSVNEIHTAYMYPTQEFATQMMDLLPVPIESNPKPLYMLKDGNLILFHRDSTINVKTTFDYLRHGISLALSHLPESYIIGFTQGYIDLRPHITITKVILPVLDLLTGCAWRIVGVASQQQVSKVSQEVNGKIDDMASLLSASYNISKEIMAITQEIQATVQRIEATVQRIDERHTWDVVYKEVDPFIQMIMDAMYVLSSCSLNEAPRVLKQYGPKMYEANTRLARVLKDGTTSQVDLIEAYRNIVLAKEHDSERQIVIATTLWYRWLIELQVRAFGIYKMYLIATGKEEEQVVEESERKFEENIVEQIRRHANNVDLDLINTPIQYIRLQYNNIQQKETAFQAFLNNPKN